ncbi:MAG: hypothetical protein WC058_07785 [Phycisphaeraceae bacterium]
MHLTKATTMSCYAVLAGWRRYRAEGDGGLAHRLRGTGATGRQRFAVAPAEVRNAHRPVPPEELDVALCPVRQRRTVDPGGWVGSVGRVDALNRSALMRDAGGDKSRFANAWKSASGSPR